MARLIRPYSEEGFVKGLHRNSLADTVIKAKSWDDLFKTLEIRGTSKEDAQNLFQEFKAFNLIISIEGSLAELLGHYFRMGKLTNTDLLLEKIKNKIREKYKKESERIIEEQTEGREDGLLSRPILQYVCGYTLGTLVKFYKEHSQFSKIAELDEFNTLRIEFIHLLLTGRSFVDLNRMLQLGMDIDKEINAGVKEYIQKKRKYPSKLKL